MLKLGFDEKLSSRLSSGYTVTSTSLAEPGLEIFLAANSEYFVEFLGALNTTLTSGSNLGLYYTGAFTTDNDSVIVLRPSTVLGVLPISASGYIEDSTPEGVFHFAGSVRTSTSGRLYVKVAKRNGADDDFSLLVGSCLVARRL